MRPLYMKAQRHHSRVLIKTFPMKYTGLLFIAVILVGAPSLSASEQATIVYYTDTQCTMNLLAGWLSPSVFNPYLVRVNACEKTVGNYYSKATFCGSDNFTISTYDKEDSTCAGTAFATTTNNTDTCIVMSSTFSGVNSYRVGTRNGPLFFPGCCYGSGCTSDYYTATYFVDKACQTQAPSTLIAQVPNPNHFNLNTCTKTAGGYNAKTACASGSFTRSSYRIEDTSCVGTALATTTGKIETCYVLPSPLVVSSDVTLRSYKVPICSSPNPFKSLQSALALFVAVTLIAYF
jgi:hypothetical protein